MAEGFTPSQDDVSELRRRMQEREKRGAALTDHRNAILETDSPDDAAYDLKKSRELGIPREAVGGARGDYRTEDTLAAMERLRGEAPITGGWLQVPENFAVARDEAQELSAIERAMLTYLDLTQTGKIGQAVASFGPAFETSFAGITAAMLEAPGVTPIDQALMASDTNVRGIAETKAEIGRVAGAVKTPDVKVPAIRNPFAKARIRVPEALDPARIRDRASLNALAHAIDADRRLEAARPVGVTPESQAVLSGIGSGVEMAPALLAGFVTRRPDVPMAIMGRQVYGQSYARGRAEGLEPGGAVLYAGAHSAVERVTERFGLEFLFGRTLAGEAIGKRILASMAAEQVQEQFATLGQDFVDWQVLNPEKTLADFIDERGPAAYQTAIATLVATAPSNATVMGAQEVLRDMARKEAAAGLTPGEALIKDVLDKAAGSKLAVRSPEKLADLLGRVTEGTVAETVVVDLDGVVDSLSQAGLDPTETLAALGVTEDQLAQKWERFGEVEVSLATVAASPVVREHRDAIQPHLRTSNEEYTPARKQQVRAELETEIQAAADTILNAMDAGRTLEAQTEAVADRVRQRIRGAGILAEREQENASVAIQTAMVTTLARRVGADPVEFFDQHYPRVQGSIDGMVAEADVLEQARAQGYEGQDAGEAASWRRAVAKGLPMDQGSRMARAAEQGYTIEAFRGLRVGPRAGSLTDEQMIGGGWFAETPETANTYSADVPLSPNKGLGMKVRLRISNPLTVDAGGQMFDRVPGSALQALEGIDPRRTYTTQEVAGLAEQQGFDGVEFRNIRADRESSRTGTRPGTIWHVSDPSNIRSEMAAFDPDMSDSADLLAQEITIPDLENKAEVEAALNDPETDVLPLTEGMQILELDAFIAFHGTQAKFDAFRTDMAGSGEGAMVYGPGHYFTQSPGIAEWYRKRLKSLAPGLRLGKDSFNKADPAHFALQEYWKFRDPVRHRALFGSYRSDGDFGTTHEAAINQAIKRLEFERDHLWMPAFGDQFQSPTARNPALRDMQEVSAYLDAAIDHLKSLDPKSSKGVPKLSKRRLPSGGSVYTVAVKLPADATIQFDRPLSAQPQRVQAAFREAAEAGALGDAGRLIGRYGDETDMGLMVAALKSSASPAMEIMRKHGVRGVRYLDGFSRGKRNRQGGSYNYVVFNDSDVTILDRTDKLFQALDQQRRGQFSPSQNVITMFEAADVTTLMHEGAHWYLAEIERMASAENAHPFVVEQWEAVKAWGKVGPDFRMYDDMGRVTPEGRELQEAFAETFEVYLQTGKAPVPSLREAFRAFKQWITALWRDIRTGKIRLPERANLSPDIVRVMDRMLAVDEEIESQTAEVVTKAEAMANDLYDRGIITKRQRDAAIMNLEQAREAAKEDLMAQIMQAELRVREAQLSAEQRRIKGDVTREYDRSPVGRAVSWLGYGQWKGDVPVSESAGRDSEVEFHQNRGQIVSEAPLVAHEQFADEIEKIFDESEFDWRMLDDELGRLIAPIEERIRKIEQTDIGQIAQEAADKVWEEGEQEFDPDSDTYDSDLAELEARYNEAYRVAYEKAEADLDALLVPLTEEMDAQAEADASRLKAAAIQQIEAYRDRAVTEVVDRFEETYGTAALLDNVYSEYIMYDLKSRNRMVLEADGVPRSLWDILNDDSLGQSIRTATTLPLRDVNQWVRDNVVTDIQTFQNGDESAVMRWYLRDEPGAPEVMMGVRLKPDGRADVNLFLNNKMADALMEIEDKAERARMALDLFSGAIKVMRQYSHETPDLKAFNFVAAESEAAGTKAKSREQLYRSMLSKLDLDGYTAYEIAGQTSVVREEDGAKSANPIFGNAGFVMVRDGVDAGQFARNELLRGTQRGGDVGEIVTALTATPLSPRARAAERGRFATGRTDPGGPVDDALAQSQRDTIRPAAGQAITSAPQAPARTDLAREIDTVLGFTESVLADVTSPDLAGVAMRLRALMRGADRMPTNEWLGAWYANLQSLARVAGTVDGGQSLAAVAEGVLDSRLGRQVMAVLNDRGISIMQPEQAGDPPLLLVNQAAYAADALFQSAPTFYSALGRFIASSSTARAPAAQWKGMIQNAPGVKAEEVEWTGVLDWLDASEGPVTREALAAFVEANGVRVEEVVRGGGTSVADDAQRQMLPLIEERDRLSRELWSVVETDDGSARVNELSDRLDELSHEIRNLQRTIDLVDDDAFNDTEWSSWTLPGGENYREMLLTLPTEIKTKQNWRVRRGDGMSAGLFSTEAEAQAWIDQNGSTPGFLTIEREPDSQLETGYRSSHWSEPNVLAHVRFKERAGPTGERVLALEEVQSDWHQAGRERGYQAPNAEQEYAERMKEYTSMTDEIRRMLKANDNLGFDSTTAAERAISRERPSNWEFNTPEDLALAELFYSRAQAASEALDRKRGVPNAPFKNNAWANLVLKRMIRYAAENGFDAVAWIPGNVQNGQIVEDTGDNRGDFYDKIVPNLASKLGKKYGAKTGRMAFEDALTDDAYRMPEGSPVAISYRAVQQAYSLKWEDGSVWGRFDSEEDAQSALDNWSPDMRGGIQFHSLPITPELAAAAMTEGFPLFQRGDPKGWGETAPPPDLPPMRLDLEAVRELYGEDAVRRLPKPIRDRSRDQTSIDSMLTTIRGVAKTLKRKPPKTLFQFIRSRKARTVAGQTVPIKQWGIRGAADELKAMNREDLINETNGIHIDYMREAAAEAGYLAEDATVNDFLNAIDREARGEPVYSRYDQKEVEDQRFAQEWADWLDEQGVDVFEADQKKLKAQVAKVVTSTAADAVTPDQAAEMLGFPTGEDLLNVLSLMGNRDQWVKEETERRLREEFGDPMADGTFEEEARIIAEAEVMARAAEIEMEALARAVGEPAASKLAKEMAMDSLGLMTVKELEGWERFLNAERREMNNTLEAVKRGDMVQAFIHKRRQLVNMHLARAAREKSQAIEKTRKDLLTYYSSKGRRDRIARDYLEKIEALLDGYELRVSKQGPGEQKRRLSAKEYVDDMDAQGREDQVAPEARLLAELSDKKVWRTLTADEVDYVAGTVRNIAHLGRTKDKLLRAQEKRRFQAVIGALVDRMNETGKLPGVTRERSPTRTKSELAVDMLREGHSWLMRPEHQARSLDGGELGPVWEALFRPMAEAADVETQMMREATRLYREAWSKFSSAERNAMSKRTVSVPELPAIGKRFTQLDLISIALNWGVTYNREVLLEGYGWTADQVEAALFRTMTDKHWDLVESLWAISGMYKAEAFALEKAMTGVEPKAVEGISFVLPSGRKIDGKYYHIQYDANQPGKMSRRQAKDNDAEALTAHRKSRSKAMTKNGGLIERKGSGGRKVKLGLSVFEKAMSETIHDIAFRRAVFDVGRIIADDNFADTYQEVAGMEAYRQLNVWLKDIAMPPMEVLDPIVKAFAHVRRNIPLAVMGYKVGTALIQPTGLLAAMPLVGHRRVLFAVAKAFANPRGSMYATWKQVADMSEFMRDRVAGYERDVRETTTAMTKGGGLDFIRRNAFVFITGMDIAVSVPTWMAAYGKAMDGKVKGIQAGVEEDAIAYADSIVRRTQTAGKTQDLSRFQRGGEFQKQISMIFGYFNNLYSLSAQQTLDMRRGNISRAEWAWHMAILFVVIPLLAEVFAGRLFPDEDDEETIEGKIAETVLLNFTGMFPGLRDAVSLNVKPEFGYRLSPTSKFIEDIGRTAGLPAQLLLDEERELTEADVRRAVNAVGALTGLPSAQINISGNYIIDVLEGSEDPMEDPVDALSEGLVRNTR